MAYVMQRAAIQYHNVAVTVTTAIASSSVYLVFRILIKSIPVTGLEWPRGFQEVKVPKFHDNGAGCW